MESLNRISELKPFKNMWKVQVKCIRKWKQYSAASGETIEMVFVDSRGDKIAATIKRDLVGQYDHLLHEGETKVLINFTVTPSGGSYRTTMHQFKIVFLPTTRVRNCPILPNNLTGLQPANFRDIISGVLDDDILIDVIGQIVETSQLEKVAVNGKDTQKISVELRNENDDCLSLVLWGKFAEEVSNAIQFSASQSIVCVLRFGKIKVWKEERSISNAYNVSTVALNPALDEVQDFLSLLPKDDLELAIIDPKSKSISSAVKEKEDFFRSTQRKTIAQVLESKQVEKCIVMATIASIDSDMGWYYLSCKVCSKKVLTVPDDTEDADDFSGSGHIYYCVKCKVNNPQLVPRYKLHLVVLDSTGNTKFLMFDTVAQQLLNKPCNELTGAIHDEIHDPDILPPSLNDLSGKTLLFKIGIERENYLYKQSTFKVLKIMTNIALINEFDAIGSPTESENTYGGTFSAMSDAPEGSIIGLAGDSQQAESYDLTPAKRSRPAFGHKEDAADESSVSKTVCTIKVKKEKDVKSG